MQRFNKSYIPRSGKVIERVIGYCPPMQVGFSLGAWFAGRFHWKSLPLDTWSRRAEGVDSHLAGVAPNSHSLAESHSPTRERAPASERIVSVGWRTEANFTMLTIVPSSLGFEETVSRLFNSCFIKIWLRCTRFKCRATCKIGKIVWRK